jgi:hypothetical protein
LSARPAAALSQEHGFHTFVRSTVANAFEVIEIQHRPNKNMHPALRFCSSRSFLKRTTGMLGAAKHDAMCSKSH